MPSQYPPPPSADAIHYPIYTQPSQPPLPELSQQETLEYQQALTQQQPQHQPPPPGSQGQPPLYPRIEPSLADSVGAREEHGGQRGEGAVSDGRQKTSRLQKACDSCSIRKVKVCLRRDPASLGS